MNKTDGLLIVVLIIAVAVLVYGMVGCTYSATVEARCLKAGYPEGGATMTFEGYCISWIDATKVVVPVEEIE